MNELTFRAAASNAVRFWEKGRLIYNLALAAIVIGHFVANLPASKGHLSFDLLLGLFVLAVLANVAYCAAYAIDLFAQFTAFNEPWLRARWMVFVIGLLFAATIAHYFAMSIFENGSSMN